MDDHDKQIKFSGIRMPNLEEFYSKNVYLTKVELTTETTCKIQTISIQNMPDEANCKIECPELKKCTFQFWGHGDEEWFHKMLKCATELEYFDSYKFRVSQLDFASNHLKMMIRLHRAELMSHLEIWAPRLVSLNVQACYDLDSIYIFKILKQLLTVCIHQKVWRKKNLADGRDVSPQFANCSKADVSIMKWSLAYD